MPSSCRTSWITKRTPSGASTIKLIPPNPLVIVDFFGNDLQDALRDLERQMPAADGIRFGIRQALPLLLYYHVIVEAEELVVFSITSINCYISYLFLVSLLT